MDSFLEKYSGLLAIMLLGVLLFGTLLLIVPQLLRVYDRAMEMQHLERLRALEQGHPIPPSDFRSLMAGRTAFLVPMVAVCAAGTVTCFLAAAHSENLFAVALTVWSVAGVVSLAAITGGVALMGRLAQLQSGAPEEVPENPLEP